MSTECIVTELETDEWSSGDSCNTTRNNTRNNTRSDTRPDTSSDTCNDTRTDTSSNTSRDTSSDTCNDSNSTSSRLHQNELESLIDILKKGIKNGENAIKYIKYPNLLVDALTELNGLVGLERLKNSVALQTVRLIENLKQGKRSTAMLNTILTGQPGVGKSRAGVIIAKIWFALGFLNRGAGVTKTTKTTSFTESSGEMAPLVLLLIAWGGTYVIQALSYMYNQIGLFWLAFVLGFIILIAIVFYYSDGTTTEWITKYVHQEVDEATLTTVEDRDIISVVSRNDFVGEYLGHTAGKTKKLLEANIGKVLFIDEAYSLLNDPRDAYGFECLNTLNLFLSENPDKIVVILAGYKDQMKASIFAAQPGLERRMMWHINCDAYNGNELTDIFFLQAADDGWTISKEDKSKIRSLIVRNESAFKAMGGDTHRLVYLSSLEASRSNLSGVNDSFLSAEVRVEEKRLTFRDVQQGLITLKENYL